MRSEGGRTLMSLLDSAFFHHRSTTEIWRNSTMIANEVGPFDGVRFALLAILKFNASAHR